MAANWKEMFMNYNIMNLADRLVIKKSNNRHLINFIKTHQSEIQSVLEVGAGTGLSSIVVKMEFPHLDVTASDIDENLLGIMQNEVSKCRVNVKIQKYDLLAEPPECDLIFHYGVIEHFSEDILIQTLRKQVDKSKYVFFAVPFDAYFKDDVKCAGDELQYTHTQWLKLFLRAGFDVIYFDASRPFEHVYAGLVGNRK